MKRNRKGQADLGIVTFVALFLFILIMAPILLNIIRVSTIKFADAINQTSPIASNTVYTMTSRVSTMWDSVLLFFFALNLLLLLISAFFIDTHPVFVLVYIALVFLLVVFAPIMLDAVDKIWAVSQFSTETTLYLNSLDFLRTHFGGVILGVIILSGIIMYAKFKYFSSNV